MKLLKNLAGIAGVFLSLVGTAHAGFDVSLSAKTVHTLSSDGKAIAHVFQVLRADATHYKFGLCGERLPLPGLCWMPDHVAESELVSDSAGRIQIEAARYSNDSSQWKDLNITLRTFGIQVPQCKARKYERFYMINVANECDTLDVYQPLFKNDLTQQAEVVCRFAESADQIEQRVQEALRTCERI